MKPIPRRIGSAKEEWLLNEIVTVLEMTGSSGKLDGEPLLRQKITGH